ncbi:MAG: hypothetical protein EZS28_028378 [Streblomastix strix]|uniref:Uncharacterized protein n=1 Tax=Streblomastix strix TaxID=222440 RepID=A0A5J4V230_9EUKA|nr:MAG: hypothetical protein EZS28_028378 [Streblomastix strix]
MPILCSQTYSIVLISRYYLKHYTQEILHVLFHSILYDEFDSKLAKKDEEDEAVGNRILERQTIYSALIDREIKLTRREVNILMRSLKRKYLDKAIDANDAAHEPYELPFETHEANLLQFPSNDQAVHDIPIHTIQFLDTKQTFKFQKIFIIYKT